ncbi:MAG: S41 family peptidase [Hyphomicrobiales bacterium]
MNYTKNALFTLSLVLFSIKAFSQETDSTNYYYCKIWGLTKYYSKESAKSKTFADDLFYKYWEGYQKVNTKDEFNQFIGKYLSHFKIKKEYTNPDIKDFKLANINSFSKLSDTTKYRSIIDFNWINSPYISNDNQKRLIGLLYSYKARKRKFIKSNLIGYTRHKEPIISDSASQENFHLSFFRYWNWIEYYFPHKNIMTTKWDNALFQIKEIKTHKTLKDYYLFLETICAYLEDGHAFLSNKIDINETNYSFPIAIKKYKNIYYVSDTAFTRYDQINLSNHNLQIGDTVLKINGIDTRKWVNNKLKHLPLTRKEDININSFSNLFITCKDNSDTLVSITIKRGNSTKTKKVKAINHKDLQDSGLENNLENWLSMWYTKETPYKRNYYEDKDLIYYNTAWSKKEDIEEILAKANSKKYLILDTRPRIHNNIFIILAKYLGNKPKKVADTWVPEERFPGFYKKSKYNFCYYYENSFSFILKSIFIGLQDNKLFPVSKKKQLKCKIAIITDVNLMSFSETFCMMVKAYCPEAIFIGEQTVGSTGDIATLKLNGFDTDITSLYFEYPDGKRFQKIGIVPDYKIETPLSVEQKERAAKFTYIRDQAIEICKKLIKNK